MRLEPSVVRCKCFTAGVRTSGTVLQLPLAVPNRRLPLPFRRTQAPDTVGSVSSVSPTNAGRTR